jgi:hypothetical protein
LGTPYGQQRSRGRNGTLPAKTSSFAFFIDGMGQGCRIGLERSAIRGREAEIVLDARGSARLTAEGTAVDHQY